MDVSECLKANFCRRDVVISVNLDTLCYSQPVPVLRAKFWARLGIRKLGRKYSNWKAKATQGDVVVNVRGAGGDVFHKASVTVTSLPR